MADLVLWKPAFFGVKPELVIKGGFIAGAMMGDGNASIPTPQPVIARPMFGAYGAALDACSVHFVSQAGIDGGSLAGLAAPLASPSAAAARIGKKDLVLNDALPRIEVESGDLRSASRRRAAALRAGRRAADGAAVFPVLTGRCGHVGRWQGPGATALHEATKDHEGHEAL